MTPIDVKLLSGRIISSLWLATSVAGFAALISSIPDQLLVITNYGEIPSYGPVLGLVLDAQPTLHPYRTPMEVGFYCVYFVSILWLAIWFGAIAVMLERLAKEKLMALPSLSGIGFLIPITSAVVPYIRAATIRKHAATLSGSTTAWSPAFKAWIILSPLSCILFFLLLYVQDLTERVTLMSVMLYIISVSVFGISSVLTSSVCRELSDMLADAQSKLVFE